LNRCKHWRPGSAMRGTPLGETLSEPTVFIVDDDDDELVAIRFASWLRPLDSRPRSSAPRLSFWSPLTPRGVAAWCSTCSCRA
jgi:hypothetical protein